MTHVILLMSSGSGNDSLNGDAGSDRLIGIDPFNPTSGFGSNEVDILTGGEGSDIFVLGDRDHAYYNGSESDTSGYAVIKDFNSEQDLIELKGFADADYVLVEGIDSDSRETSTDLFLERANQSPELIASFEGTNGLSLSDSYFDFI